MFILRDATPPPRDQNRLKPKRKPWSMNKITAQASRYIRDIERVIRGWHGGPCDTDDGLVYFEPTVELMVVRYMAIEDGGKTPNPVDSYGWAQRHTPRLAAEHPRAWFEEQERRIYESFGAGRPSLPPVDKLAKQIGLKHADVVKLELVSLVGVDRPARQRKAERKVKKAITEGQRRIRNGSTPHAESMTATKVWEQAGFNSRASYYRAVKRGDVEPDPRMRAEKKRVKQQANTPHLRLVKPA